MRFAKMKTKNRKKHRLKDGKVYELLTHNITNKKMKNDYFTNNQIDNF